MQLSIFHRQTIAKQRRLLVTQITSHDTIISSALLIAPTLYQRRQMKVKMR